jgi:hypothetical protein
MLNVSWGAMWTLVTALVAGAVGGVAFELLQPRQRNTGTIEFAGRLQGRVYDLGWLASLILGAVAATAFLYFFPPDEVTTVVEQTGETTTTIHYEFLKVVALSLIVGSSGAAFLKAMQARTMAIVNEQRAETTSEVAKQQLEAMKDMAASEATAAATAVVETELAAADTGTPPGVVARGADGEAPPARPSVEDVAVQVAHHLDGRLSAQLEAAKRSIDVVAAAGRG